MSVNASEGLSGSANEWMALEMSVYGFGSELWGVQGCLAMKNSATLEPYRGTMPRARWWS